jgi:hypothetical protein
MGYYVNSPKKNLKLFENLKNAGNSSSTLGSCPSINLEIEKGFF